MWTSRQHSLTLAALFLVVSIFLIDCSFKFTPRGAKVVAENSGRFVRAVSRQHYHELTVPVRAPLKTCPITTEQHAYNTAMSKNPLKAQRGAVVGLVRGFNDFGSYGQLLRRNEFLIRHLTRYHDVEGISNSSTYDLWLFHQGDISAHHVLRITQHVERIYKALTGNKSDNSRKVLRFESIADLWAEGVAIEARLCKSQEGHNNGTWLPSVACSARHQIGFKLMCRFYAVQLFQWLKWHNYAFVLRLDDDGILTTPLRGDLFSIMNLGGYVYGLRAVRRGKHGDVEASLAAFTLQYTLDHKVPLQCSLATLLEVCIHFRNHFFVAKTAFFTRPDVAAFLAAVDASGGFFTHGWGDSLVQALAVKMFAPPSAVAQILGVGYNHGSHGEVSAPGRGDWKLRSYRSSSDNNDAAMVPPNWLVAAAKRAFGSTRSFPFGLSTEPTTSFLPSYYCSIHVLALDFTRPPISRGGHERSLPITHLPDWVCSPQQNPSSKLRVSPQIDLQPKCIESNYPAPTSPHITPSQLALIRRCRSRVASKWISCIKKDPLFWA